MFAENGSVFVQGPTRFEPCTVGHRTPKHQALANAANAAGRVNAAFWLLRHGVLAAVAQVKRAMLAHLPFMEYGAACRAVARLDNGIQFINRTH